MKCLSQTDCILYSDGGLGPSEKVKIDDHLKQCPDCTRKLRAYESMRSYLQRNLSYGHPSETQDCYDAVTKVTFIENDRNRPLRSGFLKHLTQCPTCLEQYLALEKLIFELKQDGTLASYNSSSWMQTLQTFAGKLKLKWQGFVVPVRIPKPALILGSAVLVVALLFIGFHPDQIRRKPFNTRESVSQNVPLQLELIFPANGDLIEPEPLRFEWKKLKSVSIYRVVLLDAEGCILHEIETIETQIELQKSVKLQSDMDYFWQVEGKVDTDGSILSDMARFQVKSR